MRFDHAPYKPCTERCTGTVTVGKYGAGAGRGTLVHALKPQTLNTVKGNSQEYRIRQTSLLYRY